MKNTIRLIAGIALFIASTLVLSVGYFSYAKVNVSDVPSFNNFFEKETLDKKASIVFVGDIMLDRHVELRMEEFGEDYVFASTTEIFKNSDAVVANLEGPIMDYRSRAELNMMQFSFATGTAQLLKKHGITHVTLANNHTADKGREYLDFTRAILSEYGIESFGDPLSINDNTIIKQRIGDFDFVFIGLNQTFGKLNLASSTELISKSKLENKDAIVVVVIHWGDEYKLVNNPTQRKMAEAFINAGADTVIGHHPHVVQNIEKYKDKLIFYSLGNFIFDQYFSDDTKTELAVRMNVINDKISYDIIPVWAPRSNPQIMTGDRKDKFIKSLIERSSPEISSEILIGKIWQNR